jgi:hypothetical protein
MEAFIATLKEFGPFTLPICIVMVWAIKWLLGDRERLLTELKAARDDATAIRDKRVEDQRAAAKELLEYGDAVTHRLEEWSKRTSEKE